MQFLSPFDPGISASVLVLLSLLLCGAQPVSGSGSDACRKELCSRQYQRSPPYQSNVEYCRALRRFNVCMVATKTACLGDLFYHTNLKIVEKKMSQLECRRLLSEAQAAPTPPTPPPTPRAPLVQDSVCTYHGEPEPVFCGLFGDPHVRTFGGEFQTCRLRGAWPLFDNAYLAVQVTNSRVASDERVTAPTKLTVIVKRSEPCTRQLTYEARANESLPRSFVDGAISSGPGSAHSAVISEVEPGLHVVITLRHINATLVIRRVAGHLSFAARLPRGLADQSEAREGIQLCTRGCPERERIDYRHVLSAGRSVSTIHAGRPAVLTRELVTDMCRKFRLTDFYLDACVFDVLFTGKTAFIESAREAQRDLQRLMPLAVRQQANRTHLRLPPSGAAPGRRGLPPLVLLMAAVMVVMPSAVTRVTAR